MLNRVNASTMYCYVFAGKIAFPPDLYERRERRPWGAAASRIVERRRIRMWWWRAEAVAASLVIEHWYAYQSLGRMRHVGHVCRFQLGGELSLPLVPPILKPYFHLRFGETE